MVFGLNGGRHKLLDDPTDEKVERNFTNGHVLKESNQHEKGQRPTTSARKSSPREGKTGTGWFGGRSKETDTNTEAAKPNISSLQVNHLYVTPNINKVKKPVHVVDSVPVPRLVPGEKIPYLLPPRCDDSSTESNDDVSFHLPDLDCTDCTTDRQTITTPDKSGLDTLESTREIIEHPLNVSLHSTAAHLDFETAESSPKIIDHPMNTSLLSTTAHRDCTFHERRDSLENSEILVQLTISQVSSDLSDPNTNSSVEASTSDSADDSSEGASCKLHWRPDETSATATFDRAGLKYESIPILYIGPLSTEGMEETIQKTTKEAIIDVAMRMNILQGDEREGGVVVLESSSSSSDDPYWTATIPFKSCKSGYVSVVDPLAPIANDDQEPSIITMKRLLQAGRIIQALNYTLSLLNNMSALNSSDLCMTLRNAGVLQMMLGRFNDSAELLKQVSLYDQEEMQSLQSITLMMLGISLYGCGNFDESDHAFEKALWSLRFEMRDESTSVSSKLHIIHSYVKTLSNIACCSFHQGNTKKCLKAFSIALGLVVELLEKGIVDQNIDTSLPVNLYQLPEFSSNSMMQMPTAFNYTLSTILCNIAFVFGKVDDFSLSSVYLNKALKIQRRISSHTYSFMLSIDIMDSLAYCLRKTDRLNAAIRLYKNILKTKRDLFRSEVQYRRCMANASSFCQALQTVKTSSIEI